VKKRFLPLKWTLKARLFFAPVERLCVIFNFTAIGHCGARFNLPLSEKQV
jgi:hypothetical protein